MTHCLSGQAGLPVAPHTPMLQHWTALTGCCAAVAAAAAKTLDRDFYMDPNDAKDWGLIDTVIEHRPLETAVSN